MRPRGAEWNQRQLASRLVVIKAEIQRHDGQALGIRIGHFDDVASGDNRGDLLGIGHLAIRAAHHAMLAGDRVFILTLGGLASARNILHAHACSSPSTTEIQSPYPSSAMRERGTKRRAAEFMQ